MAAVCSTARLLGLPVAVHIVPTLQMTQDDLAQLRAGTLPDQAVWKFRRDNQQILESQRLIAASDVKIAYGTDCSCASALFIVPVKRPQMTTAAPAGTKVEWKANDKWLLRRAAGTLRRGHPDVLMTSRPRSPPGSASSSVVQNVLGLSAIGYSLIFAVNAAGSSISDVVKTTIFYANVEDFARINEVNARQMPNPPPARPALANVRLPRGPLISIDTVAVLPDLPAAARL